MSKQIFPSSIVEFSVENLIQKHSTKNDILYLLDTNVVVERQTLSHSIAKIDDKNRFGGRRD